jgi:4'-phosphopantetheinyl transferase
MLPLPQEQIHLWYADPARLTDPAHYRRALALITDEERARHDAFVFEADRRVHLTARLLQRTVLSHYTGVPPAAWRFTAGTQGRPEIAGPSATELRFNLSHTRRMVACAVARGREIGVDVEDTEREAPLEVAERFFAPDEVEALRQLPAGEQAERFFVYWTLKESYIKARGLGLSLPLHQFAFRVDGAAPEIVIDPRLGDDAATWQFTLLRAAGHQVAVCARRAAGETPSVIVQGAPPEVATSH